jgi:hypothetical protein
MEQKLHAREPYSEPVELVGQKGGAVCRGRVDVIDALDERQVSYGCQKTFLLKLFSLQAKCGANLFPKFCGAVKHVLENIETWLLQALFTMFC